MEVVDVGLARWAVGAGLSVIAEATAALDEGVSTLRLGTQLRRDHPADRAAFATAAATARRAARHAGVPHADSLVLTREAVEQASHPAVADWRARRAVAVRDAAGADARLVDLCAGVGGDAVALARRGDHVVAVERDPGRAVLLAHRVGVLALDVEVHVGDALDPPVSLAGRVVHADPDRRDATGRRARDLSSHRPDVAALLRCGDGGGALAQLVTVAPGTSWQDPGRPPAGCLTFVEHTGRLVEAVIETGAAATASARAVLLGAGPSGEDAVLERADPVTPLPVGEVGSHLLLPAPALVRARIHDRRGAAVGARRVSAHRALLTSDEDVADVWLRREQVLAVLGVRPRALATWLRSSADGADEAREQGVAVLLHGLDVEVRGYLRGANAREAPQGLRVHLVRRDDDAVAIVTRPGHR